jgi:filamentous hemagglutinin family protein
MKIVRRAVPVRQATVSAPPVRSGSRVLAAAVAMALCGGGRLATAAELPVPCAPGACANGPLTWVSAGQASLVQAGNTMTITQTTSSATLNWQSFNISADGKVQFVQPSADSLALNRIFQADPARIFGSLSANGRIYLINQNGFLFGKTATVDVRGILASTLDLSPAAAQQGISQAANVSQPAFQPFVDGAGQELPSGGIDIQAGASIVAKQGQVLLFAPTITNQGSISTPDGQTILAAGKRVFLAASDDPAVRGLLVEVGDGGTVTNGSAEAPGSDTIGRITAERGNVTLAALAVNQLGRVSATTSVRVNGSVRLLARDTTATTLDNVGVLQANRGGMLTLGTGSSTSVDLDTGGEKTVDVNAQPKSTIELAGREVDLLGGSSVVAHGGAVSITAQTDPSADLSNVLAPDAARIYVAPGAVVDVSGADTTLPMERNSLRVELRGSQLADSPLQRDGALRSQAIYVDVRQTGTRADGTPWIGSPIGDLSADVGTIQRDVFERNLAGGTISMSSSGSVLAADGARLDVSGGKIDWQAGYVRTSTLIGADGKYYDIASADPNRVYAGITSSRTVVDPRWGVTTTYYQPGSDSLGTYEAGYVEGRSAGTIEIAAPRAVVDPGTLVAGTTVGPYQRLPVSARSPLLSGPAWNERPSGGLLQFGFPTGSNAISKNYVAPSVEFADGTRVGALQNADGSAFDPLKDPLPGSVDTAFLSPSLVDAGFARFAVYSNGTVTLPAGTHLELGPGGQWVVRAGRVDVAGAIDAPGGQIDLLVQRTVTFDSSDPVALRPRIELAGTASLSTAGTFANDALDGIGGTATSPLFLAGGSISARAASGDLLVDEGALLDVSGGARLAPSGALSAGAAGSIALSAVESLDGTRTATFVNDGLYRGFGLQRGGSLSLTVPAACVSDAACADPTAVRVGSDLYAGQGFESVALVTTDGGLDVAPGTTVDLVETNWVARPTLLNAATGTALASLVDKGTLPDAARRPMSVTLSANSLRSIGAAGGGSPYGSLTIGAGSSVSTEAGGRIALSSNSQILDYGTLRAPGGSVSLALTATLPAANGFLADQAIWLADGARIDVGGTVRYDVRDDGLLTGTVLRGGSITLDAARGAIVALPGASLNVAGTVASLDIGDGLGHYARQQIGSDGGQVTVRAADGALLYASMSAAGGTAANRGGTLAVTFDPRRKGDVEDLPTQYARVIEVAASDAPVVVAPGLPIASELSERIQLPAAAVARAGFDSVQLTALDTLFTDGTVISTGRIQLDAGATLGVRQRIVLDAPEIAVRGAGEARLAAPVVILGQSDAVGQSVVAPAAGDGRLSIDASLFEVVGQATLSGVARTDVVASSEARLRGIYAANGTDWVASLRTAGDLSVTTPVFYVTTATVGSVAAGGTLAFAGSGAAPGTVLSAGGSLALRAPTVTVGTTLAAPGGAIAIDATTATVSSGGVLSTSLGSATVPYGSTQGGFAWVLPVPTGGSKVFDGTVGTLPAKRIDIRASDLTIAPGATLDVSGGGDLQAYEFVKGPGGTKDVLATASNAQQFAILPSLGAHYAPYDPLASPGVGWNPGDTVHLSGVPGLPEGDYTLLPARYALLPGAFLVTPVAGYTDLAPGAAISLTAGGTIVAGTRGSLGGGAGDARTSGFLVRGAADVARLANYSTTTADAFFGQAANAAGAPLLPRDGGQVALDIGRTATLGGSIRGAAAAGGIGASVDISASALEVAHGAATPTPGVVTLLDTDLEALAVQSLVLGGVRDASGRSLTARAATVSVDSGAILSAPQLVLIATDAVSVASGAQLGTGPSVATPAGAAPTLALAGPAAALVVDARRGVVVDATAAASPGATLTVAAGATVGAGGTLALVGGDQSLVAGTLDVRGGDLSLAFTNLAVDAAGPAAAGRIGADRIAATGADRVAFSVPGTLSLAGDVTLAAGSLSLVAGRVAATDAGATTLRAARIDLGGAGTPGGPAPASGSGTLTIAASDALTLRDGELVLDGFASVDAGSRTGVGIGGSGRLATGGSLALDGGITAVGGGVRYAIDVGGDLAVTAGAGGAPTAVPGGSLALTAGRATLAGRVAFGAGRVAVATTGDLTVAPGGEISTAAPSLTLDGVALALAGGGIDLASSTGAVTVAAGARLDASGSQGGAGGLIRLAAPAGTVVADGTLRSAGGGSLAVDARTVPFDAIVANWQAGGFGDSLSVRERGAGDLLLGPGGGLTARQIDLAADQGGISVAADLTATGRAARVSLAASGLVDVSGRVAVNATDASGRGGLFTVDSQSGIVVRSGASIDVAGAPTSDGGIVVFRLPRAVLTTAAADPAGSALRVDGAIKGASRIDVVGVQAYDRTASNVIGAADVQAAPGNALYDDASAFAGATAGLLPAVGLSGAQARVVAGIELRSAGDLTLAADWNVADWRFGGVAPDVTLRAGGDLHVDASLSDGFVGTSGGTLAPSPGASASFRLVGGADLGAANALAVNAGGPGSVLLAPGTPNPTGIAARTIAVRTGTGSIEVAAAQDVVLGNQASVIYTAGEAGPGIPLTAPIGGLRGKPYPVHGGDLTIAAGRDVVGAVSTQLYGDWLLRAGSADRGSAEGGRPPLAGRATGWTPAFERFQQGVGALAGGNVVVQAGRNVEDLNASVLTIGRQVGGTTAAASRVEIVGGGSLSVTAGGDVAGGSYYVGRGTADVSAGGAVAASAATGLAPIVALGDATVDVRGVTGARIETALNPTLLNPSTALGTVRGGLYSTYSDASRVQLVSAGGDVSFGTNLSRLSAAYQTTFSVDTPVYRLLPPTLRAVSAAGSIEVTGSETLWPAATGNLELFAARDVALRPIGGGNLDLIVSDVSVERSLPTLAQPGDLFTGAAVLTTPLTADPAFNAPAPVHAGDAAPVRIVAANGDVTFDAQTGQIYSAKRVRVVAGQDIVQLNLKAQNLQGGDVSTVSAGRDIVYRLDRNTNGVILPSDRGIEVGGPGYLQLIAGRNVDLQTSRGVTTSGNLENPALAATGASVSIVAGESGGRPDASAFIAKYLAPGSAYGDWLVQYVATRTGTTPSAAEAQAYFAALPLDEQRPLLERILFAELQAGGREAANAGPKFGDFSRAYAALETYYPGSNPDLAAGQTNPYAGDVRLYFSRAYTLAGGDIRLIAPGGGVNAGLASPPTSFGISKGAAELGVVAQSVGNVQSLSYGDFQVNESRVFAADGGNILVWSTEGNIDAGRGAKTAISAPPPVITIDDTGAARVTFPVALQGSGIQTIATTPGRSPGDVDLFAPRGVVNAGDAGIVAGNLTIAATAVIGASNISVSGTSVGVPVDTGGLGAALAGASSAAAGASNAAQDTVGDSGRDKPKASPIADTALNWLEAFVVGLGEENCKPDDLECLKRQQH